VAKSENWPTNFLPFIAPVKGGDENGPDPALRSASTVSIPYRSCCRSLFFQTAAKHPGSSMRSTVHCDRKRVWF